MTEEEKLAIEIVDNLDTEIYDCEGSCMSIYNYMESACLAGIKAGKPKWHDLRKDPNDLPEECQNVLCLCNDIGYKYCCTGHLIYKTWFSNIVSKRLRVIAWCEIPKFEE